MFPEKTNTYFSSYLLLSIGIHLIVLSMIIVLVPNFKQSNYKQVTIDINGFQRGSQSAETKPPTSKQSTVKPSSPPIQKQSAVKPSPTTSKQSTVASSKQSAVVPSPTPQKSAVVPSPPSTPKQSTTEPASTIPTPQKTKAENPSETMADELDDLLDKKKEDSDTDFLANGTWSGAPRKTVTFPEISNHIPEKYKIRGHGFSITAKITFSPEGWVSSLHLINSSGDPYIDSIFRNELRKIRIEPTAKQVYDTITKTFTISIK